MKISFEKRYSSEIAFEVEIGDEYKNKSSRDQRGAAIKEAIKQNVKLSGSNLSGSDLRGSDLRDSNLSGSNLRGSDLRGSDLSGSNLRGSDLSGSDLSDSNLSDSNLSGSDLSGSDLRGSDLRDSNLSDSNLSGSDLSGSDLRGSNLDFFKQDFIAEILKVPDEIDALRETIVAGKINGSMYEDDLSGCACLCGTIARLRKFGQRGEDIPVNGYSFRANARSPRERWFSMIMPDGTPDKNQAAKLAVQWIDEAIAIRDHIRKTA